MCIRDSYHAAFEVSSGRQPIDIEFRQSIPLYNATGIEGKPYQRLIDIVLDGGGARQHIFVETKSYKAPVLANRFSKWNLTRGNALVSDDGTSTKAVHKQFVLDRVATQNQNPTLRLGGDMQWWFHDFSRSAANSIRGYTNRDVDTAFRHLQELPLNGNSQIMRSSLGVRLNSRNNLRDLRSKLDVFNLINVLEGEIKAQLFENVAEDVFDELVTNSTHDIL